MLGLLVVGLLQMHSFGHAGHDQGGASRPMAAGHLDVPAAESPHPPPVPEPDGALELLIMCLAVMTSLGVIGALIGLLVARAAGGGHRGGWLARLLVTRGPPEAAPPLIGIRLARFSVLRI